MARGAPRDDLRRLLEPVVAAHGVDLEDIEVTPAGRRRVVRVVLDADGGVNLDRVAQVSQSVSAALDAPQGERVLGGTPYVLEVTSPGVDRPLTQPRHWRRAVGRLVVASLGDGSELTGRVLHADTTGVGLDVDGAGRELAWEQLRTGRVQVEFSRVGDVDDGDDADDADRTEE